MSIGLEILKINNLTGGGVGVDDMRKNRLIEILKKESKDEADIRFIHNFIKQYFSEVSQSFKNLSSQSIDQVLIALKYQELLNLDTLFDKNNVLDSLYFILQGKIDVSDYEDDETIGESKKKSFKTYSKGNYITASDLFAFKNNHSEFKATADGKCEVLVVSRDHYNTIIKENEDRNKDAQMTTISRNILKFKKMDRASKENGMKYFKFEKFSKGDVVVNIKSKIDELYIIEKGCIALISPNDYNKKYTKKFLVFGVLGVDQIFNESPLILEKESPYHAICIEDTELISIDKGNLPFITDYETLQDLRANAQGKERLQRAHLDKFATLTSEQLEKNQKTLLQKLKIDYKFIDELFNKSNTKGTGTNHYLKNLEKFNSVIGKGNTETKTASAESKLGIYATPRLSSKDPSFNALDPERQKAILNLRMEGMNRRTGASNLSRGIKEMGKEEIAQLQAKFLKDEKNEVAKIATKKTISDNLNLNSPHQEEEKNGKSDSFLKKMKQGNEQLLSKLQKSSESPSYSKKSDKSEKIDDTDNETTDETNKETNEEAKALETKEKDSENENKVDSQDSGLKNSEDVPEFKPVDREKVDDFGLKMTRVNLSKITLNHPSTSAVPKKKMNIFGKPGMI